MGRRSHVLDGVQKYLLVNTFERPLLDGDACGHYRYLATHSRADKVFGALLLRMVQQQVRGDEWPCLFPVEKLITVTKMITEQPRAADGISRICVVCWNRSNDLCMVVMAGFAVCWMGYSVTVRRRWNSRHSLPSQISRRRRDCSPRLRLAFSSSGT